MEGPRESPYCGETRVDARGAHADADPSRPSRPRWQVLVIDPDAERRERVVQVARRCGATARVLGHPATGVSLPDERCRLALYAPPIGLPAEATQVLAGLRDHGCAAIAYGDHGDRWSLGNKARLLLEGAVEILDSADPEFLFRLERVLGSYLLTIDRRDEELAQVRDLGQALGIVATSPAMIDVLRSVLRAGALSDLPVLISGETGTGKELLAHAIHWLDARRRTRPFVPLNCGAISPMLAESELFGHRRGSFTGADRDHKGLVRAAQGGVLFLDEIGDLELGLQGKLLRVLQEGRVLGVGEEVETAVDVRVVAASNRNLGAMVEAGAFRADLLHRLGVFTVTVPPLRDRPRDIQPLLEHFIAKHARLFDRAVPEVATEVVQAVTRLRLEGNAREVENLVRHALASKRTDGPLRLGDLPPETWRQLVAESGADPSCAASSPVETSSIPAPGAFLRAHHWSLADSLGDCERALLEAALDLAHGNQAGAARLLGITPRSVYNKIRRLRIRGHGTTLPE
jgi:transcriptional regulator with GAF, ATPase, and Fis domain